MKTIQRQTIYDVSQYPSLNEFFNNSVIKFVPGLEGQKVEENGVILIGDRAHWDRSAEFLAHEMAHFAEIDDKRINAPGWGLIYPEVEVCGRLCCEPITTQITEREIRVAAYQYNLLKYIGFKTSVKSLTSSFVFLPDHILIPTSDDLEYVETKKARLKWIEIETKKLIPKYTITKFKQEWNRKVSLLEERIYGSRKFRTIINDKIVKRGSQTII